MFARFVRRPLWQIVLGFLLPFAIWDLTGSSFGQLLLLGAPSETRWTAPLSTDNELKTIGSTTFAPVVQKVMPSVVSIYSSRQTTSDTRNRDWLNDPSFRKFFGDQWLGGQTLLPRERQTRSMGSGVIISPDGYIATNHHVVEASTDIKVLLSDRREFAARLVGTDSKTDLAVLKIEQTGLPALTFADSSKVQVGDVVLALGNPFDVGQAVSMGIVSATGRGLGGENYEDFIQTDAAINPGNSGGALVSAEGRLIGINTAIMSRTGGNQGVGFAIPSSMARNVTDQIIHGGKVSRAFLGVMIQPITADLAKAFKMSKSEGALIADVNPGSPAELAGLKPGDVITKIDDHAVADSRALRLMIGEMSPGKTVQLAVVRDGIERRHSVTLGEQPSDKLASSSAFGGASSLRALDGVSLEALTPDSARQYGLTRNTKGVAIQRVDPDSAAGKAGLEAGDVILEVNRHPVTSTEDVNRYIGESQTGTALLFVNHEGQTRYLAIPTK